MNFNIGKEEFQQALEAMQNVTISRIKNGTNGLYIKASRESNTIQMEGNNYETQMKIVFQQNVQDSGEVNILAPQLLGIVRAANSDVIEISYFPDKDSRVQISSSAKSRSSKNDLINITKVNNAYFPVRPVKEFPKVEKNQENTKLKLQGKTFLRLLKSVAFAASEDKNQYTYNSIVLECNKETGTIMAGATNTKQMAMKVHKITENETLENTKLIIPLNSVTEIIKILEKRKSEDFVEIKTNPNRTKVEFTVNKIESEEKGFNEPKQICLKTSLIEANYPSFAKLVKESPVKKIAVNLDEWKSAINFVNPLSKETKYNTMCFTFRKNEVEVHTEDEMGISKTSIPCENGPDDEIRTTFNCSFISKFMNQLEGETIILQPNENAPMQVRVKGDDSFVYVLAPMRSPK